MNETYPDITDLYPIGSSWQERNLWCLEITNKNIPAEDKTGIGVFANIHGGERESASSAMYTAWWLTLCSGDDYVKGLLDNYIIYVIPVINPDGYEQSFINNNRPNLRPRDLNGDGVPFSDPYADIDGDGFIATIYRGKAGDEPSRKLPYFGTVPSTTSGTVSTSRPPTLTTRSAATLGPPPVLPPLLSPRFRRCSSSSTSTIWPPSPRFTPVSSASSIPGATVPTTPTTPRMLRSPS